MPAITAAKVLFISAIQIDIDLKLPRRDRGCGNRLRVGDRVASLAHLLEGTNHRQVRLPEAGSERLASARLSSNPGVHVAHVRVNAASARWCAAGGLTQDLPYLRTGATFLPRQPPRIRQSPDHASNRLRLRRSCPPSWGLASASSRRSAWHAAASSSVLPPCAARSSQGIREQGGVVGLRRGARRGGRALRPR